MLPYIEYHLVDACNLNCAGCSHFSPLAQGGLKPLDEFKNEFEALAQVTNHQIGIIRLMGGEPLLHPQVGECCKIARRLFPTAQIVVVSNGILWNNCKTNLIPLFKEYDIWFCVSDYGLNYDFDKWRAEFENIMIHSKCDMYNIALDLSGSQIAPQSFFYCDLANFKWYFYKEYRLYTCCIMANINFFKEHFKVELDTPLNDISIDVREHNLAEIQTFLSCPHKSCKYCDTYKRERSYHSFSRSKEDINEWTCQ